MNLFRPTVTPIPDCDHVRSANNGIRQHVFAINDASSDIADFFKKSLFKFAQTSPEELAPIYNKFIQSGVKYAASFGQFVKKFGPVLKSGADLQEKYNTLYAQFSKYTDDVKEVRNEETKENIEKEKADLLEFVKKFNEFNTDSNSFMVSFLAIYVTSAEQLSNDTNEFLKSITSQIEAFRPIEQTKEEKDLDILIAKLEKEVGQRPNEQH